MARYNNMVVGRSTTVWPYRLAILLAWLLVPVAAYYLMRADYQRYQLDSASQRADCEKRADLLQTYSTSLADWARRIDSILDHEGYLAWSRHLQQLRDWYTEESLKVRRTAPSYYPQLDQMLTEAAVEVLRQQDQVDLAARRKDDYNNSAEGVAELIDQIRLVEVRAEYYYNQGAIQIYNLFVRDLQRMGEEYDRRRRARQRMYRESLESLDAAAEQRGALARQLEQFTQLASQDEQQTYSGLLRARFDGFNLRDALRQLIQGEAAAGQ